MSLSIKKAIDEIVAEISNITGQDTNFIDINGEIIASTNANRIGNIHYGAQKIINENLEELYVSPYSEDTGTKAGLNLPIYVDNKIFGIIGITGSYEKVYPYARLVKRITEILLLDSMQKQKEREQDALSQDFLRTWILGEGVAEGEFFINRAQLLGINLKIFRRILIIYFEDEDLETSKKKQMLRIEIAKEIKNYFAKFSDTYTLVSNGIVYVTMPACKNYQIQDIVQNLLSQLKGHNDFKFYIGIDGSEFGSSILSIPLLQAKQAYKAAILNKQSIFFNEDITIEIFVENTSTGQKRDFIYKLFPAEVKEFIPHFMKVIEAWFETDGSISKASEILFMHKNTYQYQIKRIYNCSGYDLRKPKSTTIFYIALLFYRDLCRIGC